MIDLVGRSDLQGRVWAVMVVPAEKQLEFTHHGGALKGNQDEPSALNLHGLDESLQDGDTPVLTDGSEALGDVSRPTPVLSFAAVELFSLV